MKKEFRKEYDRQRRWDLKLKVINEYGGKCAVAVCGITNPQYLTIHHINGNGADHREEVMGNRRQAGWNFYRWLVKENFPPGYQVLCWNHNYAADKHPEICEEPYIIEGEEYGRVFIQSGRN